MTTKIKVGIVKIKCGYLSYYPPNGIVMSRETKSVNISPNNGPDYPISTGHINILKWLAFDEDCKFPEGSQEIIIEFPPDPLTNYVERRIYLGTLMVNRDHAQLWSKKSGTPLEYVFNIDSEYQEDLFRRMVRDAIEKEDSQ